MTRHAHYMLDTNMASYIIKGRPEAVRTNLLQVPMDSVCISAITQAELLHGVARKPEARRLAEVVDEFLLRVQIMPWDEKSARSYAELRSNIARKGHSLSTLDMLIAAHALALGAVLVTSDQAFFKLDEYLSLADWSIEPSP
jgi:tRNA(fMet)-specific endonuclease VapC